MSLFRRRKACGKRSNIADRTQRLRDQYPDFSTETLNTIECVSPFTMTSPERIAALCNAVEYVCRNRIDGDVAECGVWRGGSMMAVARTLSRLEQNDKRLWLYDTFDGMSRPSAVDVDLRGQAASELLATQNRNDQDSVWCCSPLEEVKKNLCSTGYPSSHIRFVSGPVEQTIPERIPDRLCILRLDTDWYESTRHELVHLFPRLVKGGVLLIDDYGHWEGCQRAVDEYLQDHGINLFLNRIDYTGRIGVKVAEVAPPNSAKGRAA